MASIALVLATAVTPPHRTGLAQEGVFLTEEQAPGAVFPGADTFVRQVTSVTSDMRNQLQSIYGETELLTWEDEYVTYKVSHGDALLGYAIIVEEIGKHRPITFVVGVRADGSVNDVAVMAYREAYGGEVRSRRFLTQYHGKVVTNRLQPYTEIKNIAGATLSVEAASRAVKKALALLRVTSGAGGNS